MSQSLRDQNRTTTALGVNNTDGETPLLFLVDPITNRLLVECYEASDPSGIVTTGERDGNYVPTAYGINVSDQETPMPFLVHPSLGYLEVDIIAT